MLTEPDCLRHLQANAELFPGGITGTRLLELATEDAGIEWLSEDWGFLAAVMDDYLRTHMQTITRPPNANQPVYVLRGKPIRLEDYEG